MQFFSTFLDELPLDPLEGPTLRQVDGAVASQVLPTPVRAPELLTLSSELQTELDLEALSPQRFAEIFSGNELLPGMRPYAACYGGHQFGSWAGQLGDGRAITLGETRGKSGARWELQLKGAGPTPYSRRADGRAVVRSSVREFLCSEAMYHLGVPTTRALCLVATGEKVVRDMFYDGNPKEEPGAIVCRVAPSFLRFGNFEIFASRDDVATLRALTSYTIRHFFPELSNERNTVDAETTARFFEEVCRRTAELVCAWMRVGFVHGVMNTDNMSILGLTIDYGPYGWLEDFDPTWTPNTTDASGRRYRYGAQPRVAHWNLLKLAEALYPLVGEAAPLEHGLRTYAEVLDATERKMMGSKLGLVTWEDGDPSLVEELFRLLGEVETDMTLFFRHLADVPFHPPPDPSALSVPLAPAYYDPRALTPEYRRDLDTFLRRFGARVERDLQTTGRSPEQRREAMNRVNPLYVFRNYLAQLAIDAVEKGDLSLLTELGDVLRRPYDAQPGKERFAEKRPEWARHRAGCSMLSCSS